MHEKAASEDKAIGISPFYGFFSETYLQSSNVDFFMLLNFCVARLVYRLIRDKIGMVETE